VTSVRAFSVALLVMALFAARSLSQTPHRSRVSTHAISPSSCKAGSYTFGGVIKKGETFSRPFGGFVFTLEPMQYGWSIDIAQGQHHHLANLTPPRHFVPNPIDIEGWHFRNEANTGPNTGDVNAPDEHREFFFSPKFGTCMSIPENATEPEFEAATRDGTGVLEITDLTLGNLKPGEKADIQEMKFTVHFVVAQSACEPCDKTSTKP
jgi:hypothetical protein